MAEPVDPGARLRAAEVRDAWPALDPDERLEGFLMIAPEEADDFFLNLAPLGQAQILTKLPAGQRRI